MDEVRLHAARVATECADDTGASRISQHAEEIALLALLLTDIPPQDNIKQRIKQAFLERNKDCRSIFVMIILPIVISVISQWIVKWLTTNQTAQVRVEARNILYG